MRALNDIPFHWTNLLQKVYHYFLIASVISLPLFPAKYTNYLLYSAVAAGLINWVAVKEHRKLSVRWYYAPPLLFFLLQVVGLLWSKDIAYGLRHLETSMPFVTFPVLAMFTPTPSRAMIDKMHWFFLVSVILTSALSLSMGTIGAHHQISSDFSNPSSDAQPLLHPSYLSLYIVFCVFFLIETFVVQRRIRLWPMLTCIVLLVLLVLLNSRASILACIAVAIALSFFYMPKRSIGIMAISVILFITFLVLFPPTRTRFFEAPLKALELRGDVDANDQASWPFSFRMQIYDCALDIVKKKPVLGHGTGDDKLNLLKCYEDKGYGWLSVRHFNAHSEYLQEFIRHGLIGLAFLLLLFVIPLAYSFQNGSLLLTAFVLLTAICALPESILSRHHGAYFFSMFYVLLGKRSGQ